jgi:choline-sulfatase
MIERTRPNVLLIMVDQLAASWLPVYGHPVVQAPHLTALADQGVTFESAYCASPLCAPSRVALLSGRLPSRTTVFDNAAEMPASLPTIAHYLRVAGYYTCLAGKMHFVGPDQLHGFEHRLTADIYPAALDWTPDWQLPLTERLPWYHTMESVLQPGICQASMQMDYDDEVTFRSVRKIFDLVRHSRDQPFFFVVSFSHPHDPWELRRAYWELYPHQLIDLPTVEAVPFSEADPHSRRLRQLVGMEVVDLTEEQVQTARHGYYAAISYVDARIGEVLSAVRATGVADNTIVLFTADHGEMLGERGLWYKMSFFDPSARVPLVISVPGRFAPRRVGAPVSLMDVAPTILQLSDCVDADGLCDMDGTSLVPFLTGEEAHRADRVVGEYLAEGVTSPAVMIRRGRYKFIHCDGDPVQLYDLVEDPNELVNLAERSSHVDVVNTLQQEVWDRWDLNDLSRRVLESQRQRHLVVRALNRGSYAAWDFQPDFDASMHAVRSRADLYAAQRRARLDAPREAPPR